LGQERDSRGTGIGLVLDPRQLDFVHFASYGAATIAGITRAFIYKKLLRKPITRLLVAAIDP